MLTKTQLKIRSFLTRQPEWAFALFVSLTAFLTYSCMYAFRKPFTLATFEGVTFAGIDFKIWLITAQVLGYTLSKFIGINYVSGLLSNRRAISIILLIGFAELALFAFSIVPAPYSIIFLFLNGLPLGIIWGIVFSYLEGRKLTEFLGAVLSASFIIASGFVKTVGKMTMDYFHLSEFEMPYVTGLIFLIPLIVVVFLLDCSPPPTELDEKLRSKRQPMNSETRKQFLADFLPAMFLLVTAYIFLTVFRDLRDNFAAEIWNSLGYGNNAQIFTRAEVPVTVITLCSLALITFIRNNYLALQSILGFILTGFVVVLVSTILFRLQLIHGKTWMIATGTGVYLGYIPFNAFLFERILSTFRNPGNIGFAMYIADSFGYLGSLGVVLLKNFANPTISWLNFFAQIGIWLSIAGICLLIVAMLYFVHKHKTYINKNKYEFELNTREPIPAFNPGATIDK